MSLVPILCREFFKEEKPYDKLIISAGESLHRVYFCLSQKNWTLGSFVVCSFCCPNLLNQCINKICPSQLRNAMTFENEVISFLQNYADLQKHCLAEGNEYKWKLKPKSHLLLELARQHVNPSLFWCYHDESWGGHMASANERRGGKYNMLAVSKVAMARWRAQDFIPG